MELPTNQIKKGSYFFYSQAFADGLRATFGILLPALIGSFTGHFDIGLTVSLGAMVVSLTDAPGPVLHKRNGMLACAFLAFVIAIITALVQRNVYFLAIEIIAVTFVFSMFNVYGARASSVGNGATLIMILTMDKPVPTNEILLHGALIFSGGCFYAALSLVLHFVRPYRAAQRQLGNCIREVAAYLSIRADFYNVMTDLEKDYKRLIAQQVVVNEKQDAVREMFFKTRRIVQESTNASRRLVFAFVETVDLFEDITAAYYDYNLLRKKFGESGALHSIHHSLKKLSSELTAVGIAIETGTEFRKSFDYDAEVINLKRNIDAHVNFAAADAMVLKKIIVNIRKLFSDLQKLENYFDKGLMLQKSKGRHSHFISHQSVHPAILLDNLTLKSSSFRHAVRVCIACSLGFVLTKVFAYGSHSYWILLTIAFILKPAYSLTKQRNVQRIFGTLVGAAIGIGILFFVPKGTALFVIMVMLMIGTYSLMRINYLGMVMFTTPYVLILFSFLGMPFQQVARERILDTLIGCTIAFSAASVLFPKWEREDLKTFMHKMMGANAAYLGKVIAALSGNAVSTLEYKLARREVYLHSANLSSLFQRMLSEPKRQQHNISKLQQFVVLNHILFSNIASVATALLRKDSKTYDRELLLLAKKAERKLTPDATLSPLQKLSDVSAVYDSVDDNFLKEQLQFIYNVSKDVDDIRKAFV